MIEEDAVNKPPIVLPDPVLCDVTSAFLQGKVNRSHHLALGPFHPIPSPPAREHRRDDSNDGNLPL
jgi:hypothetical protein